TERVGGLFCDSVIEQDDRPATRLKDPTDTPPDTSFHRGAHARLLSRGMHGCAVIARPPARSGFPHARRYRLPTATEPWVSIGRPWWLIRGREGGGGAVREARGRLPIRMPRLSWQVGDDVRGIRYGVRAVRCEVRARRCRGSPLSESRASSYLEPPYVIP